MYLVWRGKESRTGLVRVVCKGECVWSFCRVLGGRLVNLIN